MKLGWQINIKFIADVHISPITITELRNSGYNINRITDFLPATTTDQEIISFAIEVDAVIITQDLDFSSIVVQSGLNKPSVISIRIIKPHPSKVTKILKELLPRIKEDLLRGCIVSVNENQFRIRELPMNR